MKGVFIMIKKFVDEDNIFVFIQSGDYLLCVTNGNTEYTITSIATLPETLQDAYKIMGLDIWYPINQIE